jgi:hypothetical protein
MNENQSKLLKNRSINQESQNFKPSNSITQLEQVIEIKENKNDDKNGLIPKPIPTNQLFDFFEELNEASSSTDKKSKYRICIKTMKNRSLRDDSFNIRLYGLEGKSKEKKKTLINNSENLHEFEFKSYFIGQLIGVSLWFQSMYNM